jgi:putative membrane protein
MKRSRMHLILAGGLAGTLGLAGAAWADQTPATAKTPVNSATGTGNPGDVSGKTTAGDLGPSAPGTNGEGRVLGTPVQDTPQMNATAGPTADADYIQRVHEANQKEIAMSRMAMDKASSAKVKSYAQKLINDHQAADKKLMAYADRKAPDVKAEGRATGGAVVDETQTRLSSLSGSDFDKEFVNVMLEDHDRALDLVKSARDSASDKQLRALYDGMLPKLEAHKKMAKDLADRVVKS